MSVASFAAVQILRALPRTRVSRAVGRLCDVQMSPALSRAIIGIYVRAYDVDLEECEEQRGPYENFDKFFTRQLKPGRRTMCSDGELASPADGKIESQGPIDLAGTLQVKNRPYRVAELIGDEIDAKRYAGGQFAIVYLSPRDYHRVHAPIAGDISIIRSLPGRSLPSELAWERHVPSLFSKNRRVAIVIDTPALGRVTVTMVGAIIVGRISVTAMPGPDVPLGEHRLAPAVHVEKGDEIGIFHLGSTAIVFVEPGKVPPFSRPTGPVRMGESMTRGA